MQQKQPQPQSHRVESLHGVVPLILVVEAVGVKEALAFKAFEPTFVQRIIHNEFHKLRGSNSSHLKMNLCEKVSKYAELS